MDGQGLAEAVIGEIKRAGWNTFDHYKKAGKQAFTIPGTLLCNNCLIHLGITGDKCNKLLKNCEAIINSLISKAPEITTKLTVLRTLWKTWAEIVPVLEAVDITAYAQEINSNRDTVLKKLYSDLDSFGKLYLQHYENSVTPYIHIVVCHTEKLIEANGSIGLFSQQGFEATHKVRFFYYERSNISIEA
jgi:hypothetical protein